MLLAALWQPAIVGCSGMLNSQASRLALNLSTWLEAKSLNPLGQRLKRRAPFTAKDASLAFLTHAGAVLDTGLGTATHLRL